MIKWIAELLRPSSVSFADAVSGSVANTCFVVKSMNSDGGYRVTLNTHADSQKRSRNRDSFIRRMRRKGFLISDIKETWNYGHEIRMNFEHRQ